MPTKKIVKKPAPKKPAAAPAVKSGPAALAKAADNKRTSRLCDWLFKWPLKFSLLTLALAVIGSVIVGLTASFQIQSLTSAVGFVVMVLGAAFLIWQSIKFAGPGRLDRRGFLAVDVGVALAALCYYGLIFGLGAVIRTEDVVLFQYTLIAWSPFLYYAALVPFIIAALYIIGLSVFNIIATYKYARTLGASRIELLLSIPFGIGVMAYPAFFVDSPKVAGPNPVATVPTKSKWFGGFIDWIMRAPLNGLAGLLLTTMAFSFFTSISISLLLAASLVAFFVLLKVYGAKNILAKGIKTLTIAAIAVNLLYIALLVRSPGESAVANSALPVAELAAEQM